MGSVELSLGFPALDMRLRFVTRKDYGYPNDSASDRIEVRSRYASGRLNVMQTELDLYHLEQTPYGARPLLPLCWAPMVSRRVLRVEKNSRIQVAQMVSKGSDL
jgi:hypothetical protein